MPVTADMIDRRFVIVTTLLTVSLLTQSVPAQPPPPATGSPATADDSQESSSTANEPDVRRLYVPVRELDTILPREPKGVLLPRDEFNKLYEQARAGAEGRPRQPVSAGITSAEFAARIDGRVLSIEGTVRFLQLERGWALIKLPLGNLRLEQALLDGEPASISRDEKHPHILEVISPAQGSHELTLQLSTPLVAAGSDVLATVELPEVAAGTFRITVPAGQILSANGLRTDRPAPDDQPATYILPIGASRELSLRISDRSDDTSSDGLIFAHGIGAAGAAG